MQQVQKVFIEDLSEVSFKKVIRNENSLLALAFLEKHQARGHVFGGKALFPGHWQAAFFKKAVKLLAFNSLPNIETWHYPELHFRRPIDPLKPNQELWIEAFHSANDPLSFNVTATIDHASVSSGKISANKVNEYIPRPIINLRDGEYFSKKDLLTDLPHKEEAHCLDWLVYCKKNKMAIGFFQPTDFYFGSSFTLPEHWIIESGALTGCILSMAEFQDQLKGKLPILWDASMFFLNPVYPGEELEIEAYQVEFGRRLVTFKIEARVIGRRICAFGSITGYPK